MKYKLQLFLSLILFFSISASFADIPRNLKPVAANQLPVLFKKGTNFTVFGRRGSVHMKATILGNGIYVRTKKGKTANRKYSFKNDFFCMGSCARLYKVGNGRYQIFKKGKKKALIVIH